MSESFKLQSLADAVAASRELEVTSVGSIESAIPAVTGETTVEGKAVGLRIELRPPFPTAAPIILLLDPSALGRIPHVDEAGEVCFLGAEGTLLDWRRPNELAVESLRKAKAVLSAGVRGDNCADYADEFEAHWRQGQVDAMPSVVGPGDHVCEIVSMQVGDSVTLGRSIEDVASFENDTLAHATRRTGLFLPLKDASSFTPLPDLTNLPELRRAIWSGLSGDSANRLLRLLKHREKNSDFVVLQVPRSSGAPALVGLQFDGIGEVHPLSDQGTAQSIKPLVLRRWDRDYLLPRGGAVASRNCHVCVVGCGAVGSRIVEQLLRAGVLSMLLVDYETLEADNTFRHLLGREYWERNKAEALAEWAEKDIPYSRVKAFGGPLNRLLADVPKAELAELDLMIFATGNHTAELHANEALSGKYRPPMLFTWLEPFGIGGHALLSLPDSPGCLECVYTSADGDLIENRMAFAAPGQSFVRDTRGCGSSFTPFSTLHATQTAVVAVQLALAALDGSRKRPCIASWKGSADEFLASGHLLSSRYDSDTGGVVEDFASPLCRECGRGRLFGV